METSMSHSKMLATRRRKQKAKKERARLARLADKEARQQAGPPADGGSAVPTAADSTSRLEDA
jgi:hypothetical protein